MLDPYLTKRTVVVCRNRAVVWKIHLFALGKKGPVDCFKDHPILKKSNSSQQWVSKCCSYLILVEAFSLILQKYAFGNKINKTERLNTTVCEQVNPYKITLLKQALENRLRQVTD